ncbi:recombinase family protein [Micromonospora sp. WMMD1082]|uniref:recombinase family protein n=1 Tax=Micromonospora sp. WMMD1082 TaxID=3016104 RepID=UPI002417D50B|nr:recombinase family protein [Micromonospora sp. WMMD1082]MDG4796903.1 recombinase family protein [Micromonospora sp. WMMD1082]
MNYVYDPDGQVVASEAETIREVAVKILDEDMSLSAVCQDLASRGLTRRDGTPWTTQTLKRLLLDPRLAGVGGLTPVIGRDTHDDLVSELGIRQEEVVEGSRHRTRGPLDARTPARVRQSGR